jgi:hypothetical protein
MGGINSDLGGEKMDENRSRTLGRTGLKVGRLGVACSYGAKNLNGFNASAIMSMPTIVAFLDKTDDT